MSAIRIFASRLFSGTYTETNEGVFYYRLTAKDTLGNTLVKTSAAIYLDHSNPVIYGLNSVVTDWTNVAPVISITTSDYLLGTTYTGSGVKTVVIKDDAGVTVASGSTSASYTLQAKYARTLSNQIYTQGSCAVFWHDADGTGKNLYPYYVLVVNK